MDISSTASALLGSGPGSAASALFGSASAESILSAGQSASSTSSQKSAQAIITAHRREINRIRGYKLELTPSEKQKLGELKEDIQKIEKRPWTAPPGRMSLTTGLKCSRKRTG